MGYLILHFCFLLLFLVVVLGFEHKALHLLGRYSMTWAMLPAPLLCLFWRQGLTFCPGQPGPWSPYFILPTIAGMRVTCLHTQPISTEMGSCEHFLLDWPGTAVLPISPSGGVGMTVMCHCTQLLVEIGSCDLFAWAGLKPQSSQFQFPK
jgi:hypothetical protein